MFKNITKWHWSVSALQHNTGNAMLFKSNPEPARTATTLLPISHCWSCLVWRRTCATRRLGMKGDKIQLYSSAAPHTATPPDCLVRPKNKYPTSSLCTHMDLIGPAAFTQCSNYMQLEQSSEVVHLVSVTLYFCVKELRRSLNSLVRWNMLWFTWRPATVPCHVG